MPLRTPMSLSIMPPPEDHRPHHHGGKCSAMKSDLTQIKLELSRIRQDIRGNRMGRGKCLVL